MSEEMTRWEKFQAWFAGEFEEPKPAPGPEPAPVVESDEYQAAVKERDDYKAKLDQLKAEAERGARVSKYGAAIAETKANGDLAELLAGLEDETADRLVQEFKALSAQIDESALIGEIGTTGDGAAANPGEALEAAIKAHMEENEVDYNAAFNAVREADPDLVANYQGGK